MLNINTPSNGSNQILVWDILVRILHWALVISFFTGYIITDEFPLHAYSGYVIFTIVLIRIVWGFIGSYYARFSAFRYSWQETIQYALSALKMGSAREYLSHNPLGAVMVYVLLTLILIMSIVGMLLYGVQQLEGPFEEMVPYEWEDPLFLIHQFLAKILISLASLHVLGVIWSSWLHRQNYILSMFTGKKSSYARRSHRETHTSAESK